MSSRKEKLAAHNYFEEIMELRDKQREQKKDADIIVRVKDLPLENNRHGLMQWYLHPNMDDTPINSEIIYVQHIPPGSKSGRQHHPGGKLLYFWRGRGHTVVDGESYPWVAGDILQLPLRRDGVVYQHFNDSDEDTAKIIAVEANFTQTLGVDKGSVFEEIENSPDFR
ncbi:cupin domain-containing protein [Paenibacillus abyssi]|uniref:Cupin type-2 domain-containing protein n=1 Tax=Paenibacillus abyssi TaxID=1340531 RepID=A0A917FRP9_9BACL|nr:cupin domain-containing protein [Paenibacillus abyssi]GGG02010.1 hypothetical protein GCM10010916_18940 [Paenibacillus abyssi]